MKRRLLLGALLVIATASSGCATGMFNNEVVCGEVGKLRFISFYGPVGVAAKVDTSPIKCPGAVQGESK